MLATAKEMMDAGEFRGLTVTVDGRVVGMLTERDLHGHGGYLHSTRVDAAMKAPVITVHTHYRGRRGRASDAEAKD